MWLWLLQSVQVRHFVYYGINFKTHSTPYSLRTPQPRAPRFLKHIDPLDLVSNLYLFNMTTTIYFNFADNVTSLWTDDWSVDLIIEHTCLLDSNLDY